MKKIFILLCTLAAFTSCNNDKTAIEFKKVVNLNLGNLNKENATLKATAVFMNLSEEKFTLKNMILDFTVDGKNMGTIVSKGDRVIEPNSEFSVPVKYSYETAAIVEDGHDPSAQYAVTLIGDLTYINEKKEEITTRVKHAVTYEYLTKKEERLDKREQRKEDRKKRKAQKEAAK